LRAYEPGAAHAKLIHRVDKYLQAISGLAELWQVQRDHELPETLRKDLEAIALNVSQVRDLFSR
jgi:hypothetical protein